MSARIKRVPANFGKKIPGYFAVLPSINVFIVIMDGYLGTRLQSGIYPGTLGPNTRCEYEVLPIPVPGISKPGNAREYPDNSRKGKTSQYGVRYDCILILKRRESWITPVSKYPGDLI